MNNPNKGNLAVTIGSGTAIGTLGGLIGLGGAEFRLPLLISLFGFNALEAVILNKAMSLIVVATALPFRANVISFSQILEHWYIIATLLSGSIFGAWVGASWATKIKSQTLYKTISILLILIALVLLFGHDIQNQKSPLNGWGLTAIGAISGIGIGLVAAVMGVAGGEMLIPTIVLLFGADIKLAGSLSLAVSLPTMLVAFARYSQNQSFRVIHKEWQFVLLMALGSILGVYLGGQLLGIVSTDMLIPILVIILLISALKVWKHS
jgi:uncharacterized protein